MNYDKIQAALEVRAQSIPGDHTIAYENVKHTPDPKKQFIQSRFIPTNRTLKVIGMNAVGRPHWQEYHGIYQLLIHSPESEGTRSTNTLVNSICDVFEATTDLEFEGVYVTIKKAEAARGISDTPWYKTPVNIYWYSQTN